MNKTEAKKIIEERWSDSGMCQSCGWHGCLYEHNLSDMEIIEEKKLIILKCISKDADKPWKHKGVYIYYD